MADIPAPTEILVCKKCLAGEEAPEEGLRPGERLHAALEGADWPEGITITGVECLQNCDHGCSLAMRGGAARWTYVYGNLDETSHLEMLTEGLRLYHQTKDGVIPWRQRPDHFKKNCIARIPPERPAETPNV